MGREGREVGSLKRRVRSQCGQRRNEKWHAAVARSAFAIQNLGQLMASGHFWKFGCGKMARLCGEAHLQVKMHKAQHSSTTFGCYDVQKVAPPLWHEGLGPFFWFVSMSQLWQAANWREGSFTRVNMYETPAVSGR